MSGGWREKLLEFYTLEELQAKGLLLDGTWPLWPYSGASGNVLLTDVKKSPPPTRGGKQQISPTSTHSSGIRGDVKGAPV